MGEDEFFDFFLGLGRQFELGADFLVAGRLFPRFGAQFAFGGFADHPTLAVVVEVARDRVGTVEFSECIEGGGVNGVGADAVEDTPSPVEFPLEVGFGVEIPVMGFGFLVAPLPRAFSPAEGESAAFADIGFVGGFALITRGPANWSQFVGDVEVIYCVFDDIGDGPGMPGQDGVIREVH